MPRVVAVFGSSQTRPATAGWEQAEMVGRTLARAGFGVITGGYGGTMEAASKGAHSAGGHVIGVTAPALFPGRSGANPFVVELVEANTLSERIGVMMEKAAGVIALPGSIGTATELLFAWNHNHIARRNQGRSIPTVAIGQAWARIAQDLVALAGAGAEDVRLEPKTDTALAWLIEELENR